MPLAARPPAAMLLRRPDLWFGLLLAGLIVIGGVVLPVWGNTSRAQDDVRFFRIAAGPISDSVFALAGLLAGALSNPPGGLPCDKGGSCGIPGMIAVAQGVDGSRSALEALLRGQAEAAIVALDIAIAVQSRPPAGAPAASGSPSGPAPRQLRSMATLFTRDLHILVRDESAYQAPQNLRGKRIALAGSTDRLLQLTRILIGATPRPQEADLGDALTRLAEGDVEAVLTLAPAGSAPLTEAAKTLPLRLLPVDGDRLPAPLALQYQPTELPGGLYAGTARTPTIGLPMQFLVTDAMPDELARRLTGVLWHAATAKSLTDGPPEGRNMRLDGALRGITIPLHPGAAAYYRDIGKLSDAPAAQ